MGAVQQLIEGQLGDGAGVLIADREGRQLLGPQTVYLGLRERGRSTRRRFQQDGRSSASDLPRKEVLCVPAPKLKLAPSDLIVS
jgi:hypothetical protein